MRVLWKTEDYYVMYFYVMAVDGQIISELFIPRYVTQFFDIYFFPS